jgi:hypothetical protein
MLWIDGVSAAEKEARRARKKHRGVIINVKELPDVKD